MRQSGITLLREQRLDPAISSRLSGLFFRSSHIIRDTGIGFNAAEQLNARVDVIIHLSLVIPTLAAALGENHVRDTLGVQIDVFLGLITIGTVNAKLCGGFVDNLVDQTIHLLAVIGRLLAFPRSETFTLRPLRMRGDLAVQIFCLGFPCHTTMLGDFPRRLLVHNRTLKPRQRGVHLGDRIAALAHFEGYVLNVLLRQLHAFAVIQLVRTLKKLVDLGHVIAPLALAYERNT